MADATTCLGGYQYSGANLPDNIQVNQLTAGSTIKVYDMQSGCSQ
jgi:hypothetical protein